MVMKADKQRLRKVLLDAISLLCKNGLPVETEFCIEATIGITLNEDDVVLVSFKEVIQPDTGNPSAPSRVWSDLDKTQLCVTEQNLTESTVEETGNNICCKSNYNFLKTMNQMTASSDSELISEKSKVVNDDFTISKISQKSGLRNRKRTFDYVKKLEGTMFNIKNGFTDVNQQPVRQSLLKEQKIRQTTSEKCEVDVLLTTVKEEPKDLIQHDVKKEIGRLDWNEVDCEDSWMYQEVYESESASYAQSPFTDLSQMPNDNTQQIKQDSDSRLDDSTCDTNTVSQSLNTQDMTPSDESCGNLSSSIFSQSTITRSASSLDQCAIVSRALQSLTRATTFDQSTTAFQTGDAAPAAVFCQICGARLASAATLIKHIKGTHLAMSMCQCEICGEQFKWTMQLCRHRKRYHMNEVPVPFASEKTDMTFETNHVMLE